MQRRLRAIRVPRMLLLAAVAGRSERAHAAQPAADELCGACRTRGRMENPWFASHADEEADARFCSAFFEGDKAGRGAPFLPCARCRRPDLAAVARRELDAIVAERERWLGERRDVDEKTGARMRWVESAHFVVGFEAARYRTREKRELCGHEAAHLFASRLEGMYADFQRLFGIDDERMRNRRHQVLILERLKPMVKASEALLAMYSDTAAKLAGDPSILVTWIDKGNLPGDADMDRHVTHHVTHLLCSVFHRKEWLYSQGFLDEGIAHAFEMRYFLAADNSCNQEEREEDFGGQNWPRDVLLAVRAGRNPSLAELCSKRTDQLRGSDHAFAWSMADWLIESDPARLADLMVKLKEKVELREALRAVYARSFFELERDWKAYVLERYPARARPPPAGAAVELPADALRGDPDRRVTSPSRSPSTAGRR